jgi:hypothetical protein
MRLRLHPWELDPDEAVFLQSQLRERLVLTWDDRPVTSIGGADVGFIGDHACAAWAWPHKWVCGWKYLRSEWLNRGCMDTMLRRV